MVTTLDAELELLGAAARRHLATIDPLTSVHVSAAVDALTDPLAPPRLVGVDDSATGDLAEVLRAVRSRLLHAAHHTPELRRDVQRTLAIAFAARELTHALATLTPNPTGFTAGEHAAANDAGARTAPATDHDDLARRGGPGR